MFKDIKEYKNKYFDNWLDLVFRLGISDRVGNLVGLYFWGGILGLLSIALFPVILRFLYKCSGII